TTVFLERFFRNMLIGENNRLLNREMHVDWSKLHPNDGVQSANMVSQSANNVLNLSPKCKICTLEELAVLRVIKENPNATQKEIASEIHKSERTVKSITVSLQGKGIISRVNGKRNGYWSFENFMFENN
ncbi:MAG: MarR family transcriptional regulator, partial [Bacteroidales bacterium]|nr:MarR family transcriptional regulator [Bacteroidales bacterium]